MRTVCSDVDFLMVSGGLPVPPGWCTATFWPWWPWPPAAASLIDVRVLENQVEFLLFVDSCNVFLIKNLILLAGIRECDFKSLELEKSANCLFLTGILAFFMLEISPHNKFFVHT